MANYQLLKADIDAKVYQNGGQEITGENLNSVLNQMVNILGTGYQFAGVATKDTNPETTDAKVFYIANGKGTYTNFGGLEVTEDEVVVLYWDSSWHKVATGIASQAKLSELESNLGDIESNLGDISSYKSKFIGDFTKQKLSIPVLKDNVIYGFADGTEAVILFSDESDSQLRLSREHLPFVCPYNVSYVQSGNRENYLLVHGKVYNNEKKIENLDTRVSDIKNNIGDIEIQGNVEVAFDNTPFTTPIPQGAVIYELTTNATAVYLVDEADTLYTVKSSTALIIPYTTPKKMKAIRFDAASNYTLKYIIKDSLVDRIDTLEKNESSSMQKLDKLSVRVNHIEGFKTSFISNGSINALSEKILKGSIIYDISGDFSYVNLYNVQDKSQANRINKSDLPLTIDFDANFANVYSDPPVNVEISVYGKDEIQDKEIDKHTNQINILNDAVFEKINLEVKDGIWVTKTTPNNGVFVAHSAQVTKYCKVNKGDIIRFKWDSNNGETTVRTGFSQEIPAIDVVAFESPRGYTSGEETLISHIDGYFSVFHYNEIDPNLEIFTKRGINKEVHILSSIISKEIPNVETLRADETATITDVVLTNKNSKIVITKGETSPCVCFVDFSSNKFGFYNPQNDSTEVLYDKTFESGFIQGHKYQIKISKIKGYIANLTITDLFDNIKSELVPDGNPDVLGISYCWGKSTYNIVSGELNVTSFKVVSLQKMNPTLMILGDSNADHGGLGGKNRPYAFSRLIKEAHNADVSIFSQGGASTLDYIKWIDDFIVKVCKPKYALISTYNEFYTDEYIRNIQYIVTALEDRQITPILATIHPSGTDRDIVHREINEWIKNSGFLYLDVAEVISLNHDGVTANPSIMNPDMVHFTRVSNEMIFNRFESDFGYLFPL